MDSKGDNWAIKTFLSLLVTHCCNRRLGLTLQATLTPYKSDQLSRDDDNEDSSKTQPNTVSMTQNLIFKKLLKIVLKWAKWL